MKITTILFDLDGTLLPMDQDVFVKAYFGLLAKKLVPYGYEPEKLISAIWAGTKDMIKNSGEQTNEKVFWERFCGIFGEQAIKDEPVFEDYYRNEFSGVQAVCGFDKDAATVIEFAKSKGFRVALATNPIFPAIATESRIRWAGLTPGDFEYCTTYENSRHSKPNPDYYQDIIDVLNVKAEECLMVGNDVSDDMPAQKLGMQVFLLTNCLINKDNEDIEKYPHGNFKQLMEYIGNL